MSSPNYATCFPNGLVDGDCTVCGSYTSGSLPDQNNHVAWHLYVYNAARGTAGIANVPSLAGGASTTVAVTLANPMPNTSYTPTAVLTGSQALLAALSVTAVSVVSTTVVNVTVNNTGLLTASGATVAVVATLN